MAEPQQVRTRVASVLEDPSARAVARVYGEAFLNSVLSADPAGALEEFASFLDDVLAAQPEFASVLLSAVIGRDDKVRLIDRAVAPHASPLFASFLRVLARHDRLDLLPLILREAESRYEKMTGRGRVRVSSARALDAEALEKIRQRLQSTLAFEPILEATVDPGLLGGLVIQVGDTVYDSSLRTRLKQLRGRLRQRSLHEIQSGRNRFSHPEGD